MKIEQRNSKWFVLKDSGSSQTIGPSQGFNTEAEANEFVESQKEVSKSGTAGRRGFGTVNHPLEKVKSGKLIPEVSKSGTIDRSGFGKVKSGKRIP